MTKKIKIVKIRIEELYFEDDLDVIIKMLIEKKKYLIKQEKYNNLYIVEECSRMSGAGERDVCMLYGDREENDAEYNNRMEQEEREANQEKKKKQKRIDKEKTDLRRLMKKYPNLLKQEEQKII